MFPFTCSYLEVICPANVTYQPRTKTCLTSKPCQQVHALLSLHSAYREVPGVPLGPSLPHYLRELLIGPLSSFLAHR